MTAMTETAPVPPALPKRKSAVSTGTVVFVLAINAAFSWVGGVALHTGYHVSVPFLATWLGLIVLNFGLSHFGGVAASVWHQAKIEAAPEIVLAEKGAELAAEQFVRQLIAKQLGNLL